MDCVVYLYPSEAAAEDGDRIGGSGFILGVPLALDNHDCITAVVTNRHVVERGNTIIRLNTVDGRRAVIPLDAMEWFTHPDGDDLAACLLGLDKGTYRFHFLTPGSFCDRNWVSHLNVGPGDDCFVVGRFVSRDGKERNIPTVRFGQIAQMPGEPIRQEDGFLQESYLVEGKSIPGYSGAPVFIQIPQAPIRAPLPKHISDEIYGELGKVRSNLPVPVGPLLLGIDYCHIHAKEKVLHRKTGKPVNDDWYVIANSGMMGVIPVWKLEELLESPKVKPAIEAAKAAVLAERAKNSSGVSLDSEAADEGAGSGDSENPSHREDFTSLVNAAARKPSQAD